MRSKTTELAYRYDWERFENWCREAEREPLPATEDTLSLFTTWLLYEHDGKCATASRHLAAITAKHKDAGFANPATQRIREQILATKRERQERPEGKLPLSPDMLESAVRWCDATTAQGWRDRALLLLGFATTLRRAEIAAIDLADVTFDKEGLSIFVRKSKTDQNAVGRVVAVWRGKQPMTDPVRAVREWIARRGTWEGTLFCRCFNDHVYQQWAMSGDTICHAIKAAVERAGIEGSRYGAHSLRAGAITASADLGRSDAEIMALSGHKSERVMQMYIRRTRAFQGRNPLEGVL